jgi:hypothetical protein
MFRNDLYFSVYFLNHQPASLIVIELFSAKSSAPHPMAVDHGYILI